MCSEIFMINLKAEQKLPEMTVQFWKYALWQAVITAQHMNNHMWATGRLEKYGCGDSGIQRSGCCADWGI